MSARTSVTQKTDNSKIKKLTFFTAPIMAHWGSEEEEFTFLVGYSQFEPNKINKYGERQLTVSFVQGKKQIYSIGKAYSYNFDMEFILDRCCARSGKFYLDAGADLTVQNKDVSELFRKAIEELAKKKIQIPVMFYRT